MSSWPTAMQNEAEAHDTEGGSASVPLGFDELKPMPIFVGPDHETPFQMKAFPP
jgi:hypothetical protein